MPALGRLFRQAPEAPLIPPRHVRLTSRAALLTIDSHGDLFGRLGFCVASLSAPRSIG